MLSLARRRTTDDVLPDGSIHGATEVGSKGGCARVSELSVRELGDLVGPDGTGRRMAGGQWSPWSEWGEDPTFRRTPSSDEGFWMETVILMVETVRTNTLLV